MPLTISDNVTAEMARRGRMTQEQLGTRLGMSQRAISRRLAGEVEWSANELLAVAKVFGIPVSVLYEGVANDKDGAA